MNRLLTCIFCLLRYVLLYTFVARTIPTYASDIILYAFSLPFNIFLPTAVRRLQEQGTGALTFVLQLSFFAVASILGASESTPPKKKKYCLEILV